MMEIDHLPSIDLLRLHAPIGDALRARKITRSANNPTGDLAEFLFCKTFGWHQENNSEANIDAIGDDGTRYQIKGRRINRNNASRQLSAIRDLNGGHFDFLGRRSILGRLFHSACRNNSARCHRRTVCVYSQNKQPQVYATRRDMEYRRRSGRNRFIARM